jgi:hypothetical protein
VGLFDKLKERTEGVFTAAKPDDGVPAAPEAEVRRRLEAISGTGITTRTDEDGDVVIAWAAKVASVGTGAEYEYRYRAIRVSLDEGDHEASGVCFKTDTEAELDFDATFSLSRSWERGQHMGSERMTVLAWLGPHHTSGGADEKGYKFSWGDLRQQVMDAVTGAGWTYKPKRI